MERKEFWEKLFRQMKEKNAKWVSVSSKNIIFQSFTPNLSTVCPFECQWPCFFNESTFYVVHISILSFNFSQLLLHGFVLFFCFSFMKSPARLDCLLFFLCLWCVVVFFSRCIFFSFCSLGSRLMPDETLLLLLRYYLFIASLYYPPCKMETNRIWYPNA